MIKVWAANNWEIQFGSHTGDILPKRLISKKEQL
jgi:hypothetical protein